MEAFRVTVRDLLLNTTLHGMRHLAEEGRHWIERIIWTIVQIVAMWGVGTSILDVYQEYLTAPTVTSLETTQYAAWNVPFPAVAFCNVNKISKKKALEYAEELSTLSDINLSKNDIFVMLQSLGRMYDTERKNHGGMQDLFHVLKLSNTSTHVALQRLAPDCDTLLKRCRWKGRIKPCQELFKAAATVNGFCCVFNMIPFDNATEHTAEALHGTGYRSGLSVLIDPQPEDTYYPVVPTFGSQVMIYSPLNFPESSNGMIEYVAASGREYFYTIDIFSQYSSSELETFRPEERGCYFFKETEPRYTSFNCLNICMRKLLTDLCRCLPYYYHNPENVEICDLTDVSCIAHANDKFEQYLKEEQTGDSPCGLCLPACTKTWYDVQSSFTQINSEETPIFSISNGLTANENWVAVHLYYPTLDSTLYKQDVVYTRTELVSNFGGILSLFNGFSFLSMVEIIYFMTIRLFLNRNIGQEEKAELADTRGSLESSHNHDRAASPYWSEITGHPNKAAGIAALYRHSNSTIRH